MSDRRLQHEEQYRLVPEIARQTLCLHYFSANCAANNRPEVAIIPINLFMKYDIHTANVVTITWYWS